MMTPDKMNEIWKIFLNLLLVNKLTDGDAMVTNLEFMETLVEKAIIADTTYTCFKPVYFDFLNPLMSDLTLIQRDKFSSHNWGRVQDERDPATWRLSSDYWSLSRLGKQLVERQDPLAFLTLVTARHDHIQTMIERLNLPKKALDDSNQSRHNDLGQAIFTRGQADQ